MGSLVLSKGSKICWANPGGVFVIFKKLMFNELEKEKKRNKRKGKRGLYEFCIFSFRFIDKRCLWFKGYLTTQATLGEALFRIHFLGKRGEPFIS